MNSTAHHSVLKQLEIYYQRNPEKVSELSTIKQSGYSSIYKKMFYITILAHKLVSRTIIN